MTRATPRRTTQRRSARRAPASRAARARAWAAYWLREVSLPTAWCLVVPSVLALLCLNLAWGWVPVVVLQTLVPLVPLALVAALVLMVLSPRRNRWVTALAVAACLSLLVAVAHVVPRFTGHSFTPGETPLRVMTANLRLGDADPAAVMAVVRTEHPDLLVLEEVTPRLLAELEARGLRGAYPHSVGTPEPGATGTMAFAARPLRRPVRLETEHQSWAFTLMGLRVWAVHPAYPLSRGWLDDQRLLVDHVRGDRPDLVLGDFNATLDHPTVPELLTAGDLRDAAEQVGAGWQPTWPVGGFRGVPAPPFAAIDHVLVGPGVTTMETRTHTIEGSDHRALVADLRLR